MANARFLYDNYWSARNIPPEPASVITASTEVATLPAGASRNPQRTFVWRSLADTGTQTLDIDFGLAKTVTCVALANVKLLFGGDVTLQSRGSAGSPGSATTIVTLPLSDIDTRVTMEFFAAVTARHWRLLWSNPFAANDYAEVGYVFLGPYWEASTNFSVPADLGYSDPSIGSPSLDGQEDFSGRTGFHTASLRFAKIDETQRATLRAIYRQVGVRTPFFCALDPSLSSTHWLARLAGPLAQPFDVAPGRYDMTLGLREAR